MTFSTFLKYEFSYHVQSVQLPFVLLRSATNYSAEFIPMVCNLWADIEDMAVYELSADFWIAFYLGIEPDS